MLTRQVVLRCAGAIVLGAVAEVRASAQPVETPAALQRPFMAQGRERGTLTVSASIGATPSYRFDGTHAPWWAPVGSGIVPGLGQFALGQQRSVAYVVADLYLVVQALTARNDGRRDRDEYRSLAADVARRPFSAQRPVGTWEYYESMESFLESGVYDRTPGGAVDPELDATTYNGAQWRLARATYWANPDVAPAVSSPEYQRAIDRYSNLAVRDAYRWSWRDAQLQKNVYQQTIKSANRNFQRSTNLVGMVIANHLTSLIDAYVTVRVRRYGGVRVGGLGIDGMRSTLDVMADPRSGDHRVAGTLRIRVAPR